MFKELVKTPVHQFFGRSAKDADVGIELEIEGNGLPESVNQWSFKPEGSLQSGGEYVSKPIKHHQIPSIFESLNKKLHFNGSEIKQTHRCSTHIHVNVSNDKLEDVLGLLVVYAIYEPLLMSLCGPDRDGNLFCLSNYDTGDMVYNFERLCRIIHEYKEQGWHYERGKYSGLNTGRLYDLNTVEGRCFPLTLDGQICAKWAEWLLKMRDRARSEPDKTFRSYWKNVRQNKLWHIQMMFGGDGALNPQAKDLVDFGSEGAYELTRVLKHFYALEEKAVKRPRTKKPLYGSFSVDPSGEF